MADLNEFYWKFLSFFFFKGVYSFDTTNNILTIQAGGLAYVLNRKYEILVQTSYLGNNYYQNVIFEIQNVNYVPLLTLR